MALFGLFGGKKNNDAQKGEFFLEFEEAQTLGDTEYMKQSKTIKRTFPKLKGNSGATIVTQVSADNAREIDPNQTGSRTTDSTTSESFPTAPTFTPSNPNLKVDSSMDMFRNMAKKINR